MKDTFPWSPVINDVGPQIYPLNVEVLANGNDTSALAKSFRSHDQPNQIPLH